MKRAEFELRLARLGDEACLARLNASVQALHLAARPEFFKPTAADEVCAWFKALLEKPTTRCWLAEVSHEAVGYLLMCEHQRAENTFCLARRWHEIDQVSVEPAFRGRGIGRALVEAALRAASDSGVTEIELSSWAFNTEAHALFRRCGFQPRTLRFDFGTAR
jgi:GNAT superfamily N-acetyltransferase